MRITIIFFILALLMTLIVLAPPPTPHSIDGFIFNSGTKQVVLGTDFKINETNSSDFLRLKTRISVPGQSGRYFETINGSDNDTVLIFAWNITHYGFTETMLLGDTKNINVTLNITRDVEMNVTILNPLNNSLNLRGRQFFLNTSIHVLGNSGTSCTATINFSNSSVIIVDTGDTAVHQLGGLSLNQILQTNWTLRGNTTGTTNITVSSVCSESNVNLENKGLARISNATIKSIPDIALVYPPNMTNSSNSSIRFVFLPFDSVEFGSCSLIINSTLNQSNTTSILNDQHNNITTTLANGSWHWTVNCTNTNNETGTNASYLVVVDTDIPGVSLTAPLNGSTFALTNLTFNYTSSDNGTGIKNCSLYSNFSGSFRINQTRHAPPSQDTFDPVLLLDGSYIWNVRCYDYAGNDKFAPLNFTFNVSTAPDLTSFSEYIIFSNTSPVEGQNITINATVSNLGSVDAGSFTVRFMRNTSIGVHIFNFTAESLTAGQNVSMNFTYIARAGPNKIVMVIDYNDSIIESNENNNIVNNTFHVSGYTIYTGNITSVIILSTNDSTALARWNDVVTNGHVFVTDTDSSIIFDSLIGLGRNSSGGLANNDFSEADTLLNMTEFNDSLSITYTVNQVPIRLRNFSTLNAIIENVPIVNSTINDTFITGILWDSSMDSGNGEFDTSDKESLVLITSINQSMNGKYGTYDFEITFPSRIRTYVVPNIEDSVVFYTELAS